jgi:hypothetical protein
VANLLSDTRACWVRGCESCGVLDPEGGIRHVEVSTRSGVAIVVDVCCKCRDKMVHVFRQRSYEWVPVG